MKPQEGSMANAQHIRPAPRQRQTRSIWKSTTPRTCAPAEPEEGHQPPILVLSRDANLVETVRKAAPRGTPVAHCAGPGPRGREAVEPEARRAGRGYGQHRRRRRHGRAAHSAFPRAGRRRRRQARGQRGAHAAHGGRPDLPLPAHAAVARPDAPCARSRGHAALGPARRGPAPERRRRQRRRRARITW